LFFPHLNLWGFITDIHFNFHFFFFFFFFFFLSGVCIYCCLAIHILVTVMISKWTTMLLYKEFVGKVIIPTNTHFHEICSTKSS
jgi:hypothetical protein